jgi:hypothetical protein
VGITRIVCGFGANVGMHSESSRSSQTTQRAAHNMCGYHSAQQNPMLALAAY